MIGDRTLRIFGLDPGLSHGALVACKFNMTRQGPVLSEFQLVHRWDKRKKKMKAKSLSINSSLGDIAKFTFEMMNSLQHELNLDEWIGSPLAIDYDQNSVYYRTRRAQVVKLGEVIGYLSRSFHDLLISPVHITSREIRSWLDLPLKSSKDDVHEAFRIFLIEFSLDSSLDVLESGVLKDTHGDLLDAFILCHFLVRATSIVQSQGKVF